MCVFVYAFEVAFFGGVVNKNERCVRVHFAQLINGIHIHSSFGNAGYDNNEPFVFGVDTFNNTIQRSNFIQAQNRLDYGIVRGGDTDIIDRLLNNPQRLPIFQAMNLQDGVDFSRHLIRATIDQMRFEPAIPTVGGEIDTLVITNDKI